MGDIQDGGNCTEAQYYETRLAWEQRADQNARAKSGLDRKMGRATTESPTDISLHYSGLGFMLPVVLNASNSLSFLYFGGIP